MKNILLILLGISCSLTAYSQRNYQEGYVITLQGDTLRGWIDFRSDKLNSTICTFKPGPTGQEQEYQPKDIYGYRYLNDGKFYVSREIEINGTKKTVFLEFLLEGIENLYYYKEGNVRYYLLEDMKGDFLYTSQEPEKLITTDRVSSYVKDMKYIGVLKYHFKDYPEIVKMADQTQYTHESMIKLVKAYHDLACTSDQTCIIYESKALRDKYKIKISAYIGYNNLNNYELYSSNDVDFKDIMDKYYPIFGAHISFSLPRVSQSFSFDLDVSLSSLKGKKEYYSGGDPISTQEINSLIGFIKAGPGYTYHKGRVRPTIEVGITVAKAFDPKVKMTLHQSGIKKDNGEIWSTGTGFYAAAGVYIKVFKDNFMFVKATYDKYATGILESNLNYLGARIGYTF